MLTLPYLQKILRGELPNDITKPDTQIIEAAGSYDGIVSLIQTKGVSPVIILENSEVGEFGFLPGGFLRTSQSLWVMKMVAKDEDRQRVQKECMKMAKRILSVMVKHEHDDELEEWEYNSIPWGVRNGAANFTGYELTLHFSENTDLSYHG